MTAPTPVTTSIMVTDKGSTRRSATTRKLPTEIQSHRCRTTRRSLPGSFSRSASTPRARANATTISPDARIPAHRPSRFPANRLITAPASGRAGTSHTDLSTASPPQQAGVGDVRRVHPPVHVHADGQAHDDLGRRDHHREERQDLAVQAT